MQTRPSGWAAARDDPNHVGELVVTIGDTQYTAADVVSCEIERALLENTMEVGNATAAALTLEINQKGTIAKRAKVVVQYRLALGSTKTSYIPQGTFWINTREADGRYLKLTCYDAMLKAQQDYLSDTTADDWPKQESDCVAEIAQRIGVELDSRSSIGTGDNHKVSMPVGRTMRDVLQQIGAANGGNWCITPAGKLYLVPLAGTGDSLPEVSGMPDCGTAQTVTGVRVVRNDTDTPLLSGDETGAVLEVENENGTQALADELARKLKGLNYAPYTCDQRHIDPAAEPGDKITIGGTAYVAYNIKLTLGPSHYADLEAPDEAGELEEEYPYLSEARRALKQANSMTKSIAEIRKDQKSIEAEVRNSTKITGGGNLILGSESFKNAKLLGDAVSGSSVTYNDTGSATVTNANSNRYFRWQTVNEHASAGVTLCLSVMYKPVSGTDELCMEINYNNTWAAIKAADQIEIKQTNGWVLRYGLWTPSSDAIVKQVDIGSGLNHAGMGNYTNKFELLHPMLQYGNAPTAWTASSGDYITEESAKSLISQSADEIKTEVSSLKETTTTISNDLDSTKREFKTVKESVSAIDQKADSITQTVTQRITGGNNIIAGTDDWNNATLDAGGNDLKKKGTYTLSGESVRVTNKAQNTRFHFGADKTLMIAKGMTYCASVLYKLNSGTDSLFLQFETKSSSGAKSYYGNAFKNAKQDIELDNGWKLRWAAFTATADGYADGLFVSTADDNATVTNDLTIMHPMVQMGNAPTAWTASTGDYLTANETKTEIKQTFDTIKLTASTSGTSSTIKLTAGGTEITSAQINLSGVVTFSDLSTWNQDKTIINGGNITTGQLHNLKYNTVYDLDNAWIRMGTEAGERVYIDNRHIAWYATINTGSIGLTGVLYSEAGSSYIGACSKYAKYGWVDGLDPTSYIGMQITYNRSDDSDADFNTTRVGVSGKLNVHNLDVWGSKSRVVPTSFGALKMAAFETPLPTFADWGKGQCGPEGWCLIALDPRYAETIAQYGQPAWLLTDCDGTGQLWAENCGQYAIVHGAPGQKFSWLAMAAQRGYEGSYADRSDSSYPAGDPAGINLAASTAARAQDESTTAADDLLAMDTGADETADILLDESERLT